MVIYGSETPGIYYDGDYKCVCFVRYRYVDIICKSVRCPPESVKNIHYLIILYQSGIYLIDSGRNIPGLYSHSGLPGLGGKETKSIWHEKPVCKITIKKYCVRKTTKDLKLHVVAGKEIIFVPHSGTY